jgi:hypothetical protein
MVRFSEKLKKRWVLGVVGENIDPGFPDSRIPGFPDSRIPKGRDAA